ncbi:MAG: rplC [Parachlamydiales bacterium]|nr:rplC [Parachlamydiales bacterium]
MSLTLIGQKKGMAQVFDNDGKMIVCTVILVEPNPIVQVKNTEVDGYRSIQLGGMPLTKSRANKMTKPLKGHFAKANIPGHWRLKESRVEKTDEYQAGQSIDLSIFSETSHVDVQGVTKGKGFQGVMKLHGFAGGPGAHGSGFHRHAGSTGQRTTPGRCPPNGKRASRMGGDLQTTQSLRVVAIKGNVLLVEGAVPGARGSVVYISRAKKVKQKLKK